MALSVSLSNRSYYTSGNNSLGPHHCDLYLVPTYKVIPSVGEKRFSCLSAMRLEKKLVCRIPTYENLLQEDG